jgi:Uma2 family endonuclease
MTSAAARRKAVAKIRPSGRLDICVNGNAFIPAWVVDHDSYRRWARSDEFPEQGRFAFLNGTIWIDLTMEQLFSHNAVKTEFTSVLRSLVKRDDLGYLFSDGTLVSHAGAGLSTEPDACFASYDAVSAGRVRWIQGAEEGYVEVEGSLDMTLEVLSPTSEHKDTVDLRQLYCAAGVSEYWLVDARQPQIKFSLLKRTGKGYVETRRQADGWLKSAVFGRSFRLSHTTDRLGKPACSLEVR